MERTLLALGIGIVKWGGLTLAVVNLLAFVLIDPSRMPPPEGGDAPAEPPSFLGMAVFGLFAFALGWIADRKSRLGGRRE